MPFLSVVLPCYGVEDTVGECLASILNQSFTDLEVVGVDDASLDRSGEVLREHASRDPRVRVVRLPENRGLGPARNAGLDEANGEYVLFVDSDDLLDDGALAAIAGALRANRPDVLLFDYARVYQDGERRRNVRSDLFHDAPRVFRLAERPSVINLMMVAWNKAFRRRFLVDLDLRFRPGYYEDIPVTYPALMAAERISMLDRVCYLYRQHPASASITSTRSDRHFEVFDQYRAVFEFMDAAGGRLDEFRPEMFRRMLWHYFVILRRGDRVRQQDRRRFFLRIAEDFRRYRPFGYHHPPGAEGLRARLAERRAYGAYQLLVWLRRAVSMASRAMPRLATAGSRSRGTRTGARSTRRTARG